nr:unnamed protein product [Digitaria exilis]
MPNLESLCLYSAIELPKYLKLKSVEIIGFTSAKILVELACCIVKSAVSLERLTLNTSDSGGWCSGGNSSDCQDLCYRIEQDILEEASRAVVTIRRYIEDKVPPYGQADSFGALPLLKVSFHS